MSAQPLPTPALDAGQQAAADAQYYRAVLHELIDIGMTLARTVIIQPQPAPNQDATTPQAAQPAPQTTPAFDRLARTIRRTVLLARRVAEPFPTPANPEAARTLARRRILREVEDTIDRRAFRARTPLDTGALHAELHERLDSPDLDDDIASRPIDDIITDIVRDLGLDWSPMGVCPSRRRTPQDIAALHARAAAATAQVGRISEAPSATTPAPAQTLNPGPTMVPIHEDSPPDLAAMLALCAQLIQDG